MNTVDLVGAAWGIGASQPGCERGPDVLRHVDMEIRLRQYGIAPVWRDVVRASRNVGNDLQTIRMLCRRLAEATGQLVAAGRQFGVFGGDHSCAIGTWSGVRQAIDGPLGLLWIDAHMDAHTPATSSTGALHGMPLACLLGHGDPDLTGLIGQRPAIRPQDTCLVGIRSFEPEEQRLLDRLGVRVYTMADVDRLGLDTVLDKAVSLVTAETASFGISIDLDAVDPADAPGVGTPAAGGIRGTELVEALDSLTGEIGPVGLEIAELNPDNDPDQRTAVLTCALAGAVLGGDGQLP